MIKILRKFLVKLFDLLIEIVGPKVVLTYIDNLLNFTNCKNNGKKD